MNGVSGPYASGDIKETMLKMAEEKVVYITEVPKADEIRLFENEPDIMNVQQVAQLPGVVPATIRREIQRGSLECIHVGKSVRITKIALLRYVEEQN